MDTGGMKEHTGQLVVVAEQERKPGKEVVAKLDCGVFGMKNARRGGEVEGVTEHMRRWSFLHRHRLRKCRACENSALAGHDPYLLRCERF